VRGGFIGTLLNRQSGVAPEVEVASCTRATPKLKTEITRLKSLTSGRNKRLLDSRFIASTRLAGSPGKPPSPARRTLPSAEKEVERANLSSVAKRLV